MHESKTPGVAVMVLTERELEMLKTWGAAYRSFVADYFRQHQATWVVVTQVIEKAGDPF